MEETDLNPNQAHDMSFHYFNCSLCVLPLCFNIFVCGSCKLLKKIDLEFSFSPYLEEFQ